MSSFAAGGGPAWPITKQGKLVAYEAATLKGTTIRELQVGPDGSKLDYEE